MDLGKNQQIPKIIFKSTFFVIFILFAPSILKAKEKPLLTFGAGITRNRDANIFYKGEPIYADAMLRITDSIDISPQETLKIGDVNAPWYDNIDIKFYKFEKTLDDMQQFEKVLLNDVKMELLFESSKNELKKANEGLWTIWVYDPNLTSSLLPGKYIIDITFDETRLKQSQPDLSVDYRSNAIEIEIQEPNNVEQRAEVISHQGTFYSRKNKQETAIKLFRQALELDPTRQDIHCGIGRSYEMSGDLNNAIKEYQIYVDWVRSLNIPRTGKDDINLHADIIENNIKMLEQFRRKK